MSFALRARGTVDRLTRHMGGGATITLRRHHTLTNARDSTAITALSVNGTVAAGGSSFDLDATDLGGGVLPIGIDLTHDGNTYTTTNSVRVNTSGVLSGVTFTPVLASEATDNDTVTFSTTYKDYTIHVARREYMAAERGDSQAPRMWKVIVSGVPGIVEPNTETDEVQFDGKWLKVVGVEALEPGTENAGHVLELAA